MRARILSPSATSRQRGLERGDRYYTIGASLGHENEEMKS